MLLRLDYIKEVGRFSELKQRAPQLSKLALIYARNGYGKSTFSAVMRSASSRDSSALLCRRRVQSTNPIAIQLSCDFGTSTFADGRWTKNTPIVHVFDHEYVLRNLHIGDSVTRENKRNLLPVVLGEAGVAIADKISKLDQEQRQVSDSLRQSSSLLRAKFPMLREDDVLEFCAYEIPEDIHEQIAEATRDAALAASGEAVRKRDNLQKLTFPSKAQCSEVLSRTLEAVSNDAQRLVSEHLHKHQLGPNGERWLQFGLEQQSLESCPYCDQRTAGLDLLSAYRAYFSDAFRELIKRSEAAYEALHQFLESDFRLTLTTNASNIEFWQTMVQAGPPPALSTQEIDQITDDLSGLRDLLSRKKASPLTCLQVPTTGTSLDQSFALMEAYNERVEAWQAAATHARERSRTTDPAATRRRLEFARGLIARLDADNQEVVRIHLEANARKAEIDVEKKEAQDLLRKAATKATSTAQKSINLLLADFGARFQVVETSANFKGREPNADFMIAIDGYKVPAGERSETEPSFSTVLSAADKTTLALALFLSQLKSAPSLANDIVVFDDPFSSQDLTRQFETTSQIRSIAAKAKQTIVLSHDPRFLHRIEKDADRSLVSTFQLLCTEDGRGSLDKWSSEREISSPYNRRAERIRAFARSQEVLDAGSEESIHQAIRPFLEDYLRSRFPNRFPDGAYLYDMAVEIEGAGEADPLFHQAHELKELNNFSRTSMHAGDNSSYPDELQAQCKKVVRIVGEY